MSRSGMISLRLPEELLERAEALIPALDHLGAMSSTGAVTRSDVLRLALVRGLAELERAHPPKRKPSRR